MPLPTGNSLPNQVKRAPHILCAGGRPSPMGDRQPLDNQVREPPVPLVTQTHCGSRARPQGSERFPERSTTSLSLHLPLVSRIGMTYNMANGRPALGRC